MSIHYRQDPVLYLSYMNNKLAISIISVLAVGLLGMTATSAFLYGQLLERQTESAPGSLELSSPQNSNSNLALNGTPTPPTNTNGLPPLLNSNGQTNQPQTTQQPTNQEGTNPLADHDTWISFSADPTSFEQGSLVVESASVPEVLVCDPDITTEACEPNEILIYYVDALTLKKPGSEQLGLKRSTDGGETWSEVETIIISNSSYTGPAVDPSAVLLSDGRIRLYYFGPINAIGDPAADAGDHSFYSAISTDGINFTQETGVRLALEKITDPEVTLWNNTWYMIYSAGQNSGLATSPDGLEFTDQGLISPSFGGVPGLVVTPEGLRAYGCQMGIQSALSTDGTTFTKNSTAALQLTGVGLCDPAVDHYQDEYVMVYKVLPPITTQKQ